MKPGGDFGIPDRAEWGLTTVLPEPAWRAMRRKDRRKRCSAKTIRLELERKRGKTCHPIGRVVCSLVPLLTIRLLPRAEDKRRTPAASLPTSASLRASRQHEARKQAPIVRKRRLRRSGSFCSDQPASRRVSVATGEAERTARGAYVAHGDQRRKSLLI